MRLEVVPFSDDHLEDAAARVAAGYAALRSTVPVVSDLFEDPAAVLPLIEKREAAGPGVAALLDGRLVGFGASQLHTLLGIRTAYVPDFGHAADGRETCRALIAALADLWAAEGRTRHVVTVLAHDTDALDAWFSMGFGTFVVDAVRDLDPPAGPSADVEIRRATPDDAPAVAAMVGALDRHLAAAPIFRPSHGAPDEAREAEWLAEPDHAMWLALAGGEPAGFLGLHPSSRHDFAMPTSGEASVAVSGAFVREDARGLGVSTALLDRSLAWARERGYQRCVVDYESANLSSVAFWEGAGFRPVCLSLERRIDARVIGSG